MWMYGTLTHPVSHLKSNGDSGCLYVFSYLEETRVYLETSSFLRDGKTFQGSFTVTYMYSHSEPISMCTCVCLCVFPVHSLGRTDEGENLGTLDPHSR